MDFAKIKSLITGIPASQQEQDALRKQNEQMISDDIGAIEAKRDGRAMTAGEQSAEDRKMQMVDNAANNVAGFMGSIGTVKSANPDLLYKIGEKLSRGERLNAAEAYAMNKAGGNGVTVVDPRANPFDKLKSQLGRK